MNNSNIPLQTHNVATRSIDCLTKNKKQGSGYDLVNKSTICNEKWIKDKVRVCMLKVMTSKVSINLNMLDLFIKGVVSNPNNTFLSQYIEVG